MIFSEKAIKARQEKAAHALEKLGKNVLVYSGEPIGKPGGLDQTYPFLPHPQHYWLSGIRRSGCIMAYSPGEGWASFVRPIDEDEILWEGSIEVPEGCPVSMLAEWLKKHSSNEPVVTGAFPKDTLYKYAEEADWLIDDERRTKDAEEISLIRQAAKAASAGFAKVRSILEDPKKAFSGLTERMLQIELEAEFMRNGAHGTSFDTIAAAGRHASVLHFSPSLREVKPDDMVMIDAGTEINEYSCDITRTMPAGGKFEPRCKNIYDLVLKAQLAAIAKAAPGIEWHDVHETAARVIADGLVQLKIMKGCIDDIVETGAIGMFLPHGIGHMLGLRVRDVGGKLKGREKNTYAGAGIRVDMPLREGFVMTVEPGIYFVEPMLNHPARRAKYDCFINRSELEKWIPVGGCRIEDDILIVNGGREVITSNIPK